MCGIFGFCDYEEKSDSDKLEELANALARESTVRGIDATGIAWFDRGKLNVQKEAKSAYQMELKIPKGVHSIIGHTRHATQGSEKKMYNNHPFWGKTKDGKTFALCHNGVIVNDVSLRKKNKLPHTKIQTDSYIAVQLLERNKKLSFDGLSNMAEALDGSFSFNILDEKKNTYLVKGESPVSILHFMDKGIYVYASTDKILWRAVSSVFLLQEIKKGRFEEITLKEGEMLRISPEGDLTFGSFNYTANLYLPYSNWWERCVTYGFYEDSDDEDEYIENLKTVAKGMGYDSKDIDELIELGYSPYEIEDFIYGEEGCYEMAMG